MRRIRLGPDVSLGAFFAEVERFYAYVSFHAIRVDPFTAPPGIEARLLLEGYQGLVPSERSGEGKPRPSGSILAPAPVDKPAGSGQAFTMSGELSIPPCG